MNKRIKADIELLPSKPGVYQMIDDEGVVIYVGKAKNLKNRVSQYFLRPQNGKTFAMVSTFSLKVSKYNCSLPLVLSEYPNT